MTLPPVAVACIQMPNCDESVIVFPDTVAPTWLNRTPTVRLLIVLFAMVGLLDGLAASAIPAAAPPLTVLPVIVAPEFRAEEQDR